MDSFLTTKRKWKNLKDSKYFTFVHRKFRKELALPIIERYRGNKDVLMWYANLFSNILVGFEKKILGKGERFYTLDFITNPSRVHILDENQPEDINLSSVLITHHLTQPCSFDHLWYRGKGKNRKDSVVVLCASKCVFFILFSKNRMTEGYNKRFLPEIVGNLKIKGASHVVEWKKKKCLIFFKEGRHGTDYSQVFVVNLSTKRENPNDQSSTIKITERVHFQIRRYERCNNMVFLQESELCVMVIGDSLYVYYPGLERIRGVTSRNEMFPNFLEEKKCKILAIHEPWKNDYLAVTCRIDQSIEFFLMKYSESQDIFLPHMVFQNLSCFRNKIKANFVLFSEKSMFILDVKFRNIKMMSISKKKVVCTIPIPIEEEEVVVSSMKWDHDKDGIIISTENDLHFIKILNKKKITGRSKKYLVDDTNERIRFLTSLEDESVLSKQIILKNQTLYFEFSLLNM